MTEHIGPTLWHGREVNSCTHCKYLRCQLVKSGRHPDYEYYCMHPKSLSGEVSAGYYDSMLLKINELLPDKLERGEFISNDNYTPETPGWCPVINKKP